MINNKKYTKYTIKMHKKEGIRKKCINRCKKRDSTLKKSVQG